VVGSKGETIGQTGEKPAALGFFSQGYLALRGAFGNGLGK